MAIYININKGVSHFFLQMSFSLSCLCLHPNFWAWVSFHLSLLPHSSMFWWGRTSSIVSRLNTLPWSFLLGNKNDNPQKTVPIYKMLLHYFLIQLMLVFNQSLLYIFLLIFSWNKISIITLLLYSLTFCSLRKQAKEVSIFAGASLVFRIFICSVIQKDQESQL